MDRQQEISIVTSCQHGDRTAMDTLVRKLQKPVYNAAYRMLGNADDAADVTLTADADVFQQILEGDLDPTSAFMTGRLSVDGDMGMAMQLGSALS